MYRRLLNIVRFYHLQNDSVHVWYIIKYCASVRTEHLQYARFVQYKALYVCNTFKYLCILFINYKVMC